MVSILPDLDRPPERLSAVEAGVRRSWNQWGVPGAPAVVLVHGAGANSRWWDHLAPAMLRSGIGHVVACDLTGHGDSDWVLGYSLDGWAQDVEAIRRASGAAPDAVLIGHSLGGVVALTAVQRDPAPWGGLVVVDSPVGRPFKPVRMQSDGDVGERVRYALREQLLSRFRLVPDQPLPDRGLLDYIAGHSVTRLDDNSWVWKFDPAIFSRRKPRDPVHWSIPDRLAERVGFVWGEHSGVVRVQDVEAARDALGDEAVFAIAGAHHHLILDSPQEFLDAMDAVLARWASSPRS
ncbi:alpha/beta fold hydrolase [Homoserinimonas sp. A447]